MHKPQNLYEILFRAKKDLAGNLYHREVLFSGAFEDLRLFVGKDYPLNKTSRFTGDADFLLIKTLC